jgi:5-deoxy-glucuronate isomerase
MKTLLLKPSKEQSGEILAVTPDNAPWNSISLRVIRLQQGERHVVQQPKEELVLVMLGGTATIAACGEQVNRLGSRKNVFDGMPHALYVPLGTAQVEIVADSEVCEVAVCGATAERSFPMKVIQPQEVEIEVRGGENATRQINHIVKPDFPADRILIVEVYTPSGNWSSYPPHKHDVHNPPDEVDLDEIYFYKISSPEGFAIQRVYTKDGARDETFTVRDNETILIPDGYHPVVAAHGYDCYYLNILAGSARSMAASDDPDYAWVRGEWKTKDPRVPVVR